MEVRQSKSGTGTVKIRLRIMNRDGSGPRQMNGHGGGIWRICCDGRVKEQYDLQNVF